MKENICSYCYNNYINPKFGLCDQCYNELKEDVRNGEQVQKRSADRSAPEKSNILTK